MGLLSRLIPAMTAGLALSFSQRSRPEELNVRAIYLFHRSGDPLVTVASDEALPIDPNQLGSVLEAVRDFVGGDHPSANPPVHTTRRLGEEHIIGVRGQFVSACAVLHGRGDGSLRRNLVRFVRDFEERNEEQLKTWEKATSLAGEATQEISGLMDLASPAETAPFDVVPTAN